MPALKNIFKIGSLNLHPVIYGLINSVASALVLSIVLALVFFLTPMKETMLASLSIVIIVVSVFLGGKIASKITKSKGLVIGTGVGLSFFVLIGLISLITGSTFVLVDVIKNLALCIIAGALGGIIGVSAK